MPPTCGIAVVDSGSRWYLSTNGKFLPHLTRSQPSFQNLKGFDIYDAFNVIDYHVDFMVKKLKILRDHTAKTYPDDRIFDIISEALELSETLAVENEDWSDKGVFCLGCEVTK